MIKRTVLLLLHLAVPFAPCAAGTDSLKVLEAAVKAAPGDGHAWVHLGHAYLDTGDFKRARKAFWKAARGKSAAAAYNGLGLAYMQDRRPYKLKALEFFRRALGENPGFVEARMNIARLHIAMGNLDAEAALKDVIEADSTHRVQALYWVGRYKMWQMSVFLEGAKSAGRIRTAHFGKKSRSQAIGYLKRALAIDPDHRPAVLLLGAAYYEADMPGQMVELFETYLMRHPSDRDIHLYIGLGYQAQQDLDRAYGAYRKGISLMPAAERAFAETILHTDGNGSDRPMPDAETIETCWTIRDPLFITPVNERLMEHYRRVAYANLRFGDPAQGIEGWLTPKGKAYIRYGEPAFRQGRPYQTETWIYTGFSLVFSYTGMWDSWGFRSAWLNRREIGFEGLVARVPEVYKDPYRFRRYHTPYQIAQFRGENGETRVEVYYALPGEEVDHRQADPGVEAVGLKKGLFLFNGNCEPVLQRIEPISRMPWVVYDAVREGYLFASERLALQPGAYYLAAEVEDSTAQTVGAFRDSLAVRRFGHSALEVSSLLLARRIEEQEDRPFGRDRYMVLPEPLKQCTQGGQISVYFEVYNLARDAFGATHYRITYQLQVLSQERGAGGPEWATAVTQTYRGGRSWEPHHLALDVDVQSPGPRAFRVVVEDLQNRAQAVASTDFRVVW